MLDVPVRCHHLCELLVLDDLDIHPSLRQKTDSAPGLPLRRDTRPKGAAGV